jgi:Na+/pantothenate symporter
VVGLGDIASPFIASPFIASPFIASPFIASPFMASFGAALAAGLRGAPSVLVGALLQLARVAVKTKLVTKPMILKFMVLCLMDE